MNTCADERDLLSDLEHAVNNRDLQQLLQVYAENVDLAAPLPTSVRFSNPKIMKTKNINDYLNKE